ncbi:MAG: DMT family transporter [Gammaproteobacteria bacterium]|nr:DMT family transporter [Gammaproteobacteria bacterium]
MVHTTRDRVFALMAPVFWSITGVTIRFIDSANEWQINFYRSTTLGLFVLALLLVRYRTKTFKIITSTGGVGIWAGVFVGSAMICNIVALTHTTVANAVLLMASGPIFAAVLGWILLRETVTKTTWIAIILALAGIAIMVGGDLHTGGLLGDIVALIGVAFFGAYAIALRYGQHTDMTPAVLYAGIFGALVGGSVSSLTGVGLSAPIGDIGLCAMLGIFQLGIGSVLFALAAHSVPAVELTLYALGEPILAPIWTWIGVGEVPAVATLIGGTIMLSALLLHVLGLRQRTKYKTD